MPDVTNRSIELSVRMDADSSEVWSALTEAEGITQWLAPEARVTPGVGGTYWVSWGGGMEYAQRIEAWEPGRRLRTGETREKNGKATAIAVDWTLEAKDGHCTVRLVHSGFGRGEEWDGEYEGTKKGWRIMLRSMRNSLRRGAKCRSVFRTVMVNRPTDEVWRQVVGDALEGVREGERCQVELAEPVTGVAEVVEPPNMLVCSHEAVNGKLTLMVEGGKTSSVTVLVQTFGLREERFERLQARWLAWADSLREERSNAAG